MATKVTDWIQIGIEVYIGRVVVPFRFLVLDSVKLLLASSDNRIFRPKIRKSSNETFISFFIVSFSLC